MNAKISFLATLILLFLVFLNLPAGDKTQNSKHPEVDFTLSCKECHQEVTPEVYQDWKNSKHGVMNYGCYMCHGDGVEEFYPSPQTERCIACHSPQEVDFSALPVKNCFDCHKGHTLKFHMNK
ncbi:MAG: hypothetical protein Kow0042_24900 [Calditrichia bacterium]